jgi:hypothetical protein
VNLNSPAQAGTPERKDHPMFAYLLSLAMAVSPLATGNHGHHFGWRNQTQSPPPPPSVTLVTPRPGDSSPGPSYGAPPSDPNPGPFRFGN